VVPARTWASVTFHVVCAIEALRDAAGRVLEDTPHVRYQNAASHRRLADGAGPFCAFRIPRTLSDAGVYVITEDDRPAYVGEAQDLAHQFNNGYGIISPRNCFVGGQATNVRVNRLVLEATKRGASLALWFAPCAERNVVRQRLRTALRPPWNLR
jgi:hypothetical protein